MKFQTLTLATSCALVLIGCQLTGNSEQEKKSESYQYQFNLNGCNTGKHKFNNKSDYCDGLANESLNKGCAFELRLKRFQDECGSASAFGGGSTPAAEPTSTPTPTPTPSPEPRVPAGSGSEGDATDDSTSIESLSIDAAGSLSAKGVGEDDERLIIVQGSFRSWQVVSAHDFNDGISLDSAWVSFPALTECDSVKLVGTLSATGNSVVQIEIRTAPGSVCDGVWSSVDTVGLNAANITSLNGTKIDLLGVRLRQE